MERSEKFPKNSPSIKLIMLGHSSVGKSTFVRTLIRDFNSIGPTLGIDYSFKTLKIDGKEKKIQIMDTAGSEIYGPLSRNYYKDIDGCFLVYDTTNRESFKKISFWEKELVGEVDKDNIKVALIGTKIDKKIEREVEFDEGHSYANENDYIFKEIDARNIDQVDKIFELLCKKVNKMKKRKKIKEKNISKEKAKSTITGIELAKSIKSGGNKEMKKKCCWIF